MIHESYFALEHCATWNVVKSHDSTGDPRLLLFLAAWSTQTQQEQDYDLRLQGADWKTSLTSQSVTWLWVSVSVEPSLKLMLCEGKEIKRIHVGVSRRFKMIFALICCMDPSQRWLVNQTLIGSVSSLNVWFDCNCRNVYTYHFLFYFYEYVDTVVTYFSVLLVWSCFSCFGLGPHQDAPYSIIPCGNSLGKALCCFYMTKFNNFILWITGRFDLFCPLKIFK